MNSKPLSPDDPRLTAYALGELDIAESARLAEALKNDAAARAVVEEIRSLAGQLQEALDNEPVLPSLASSSTPATSAVEPEESKVVLRFPGMWILGLAAACVMVTIASLPSRPGAFSDQVRVAQGDTHVVPPSTPPTALTPAVIADPGLERPVLPVVDNRKRVLTAEPSDVKPAPLRDDGLGRWRSVTDNREVSKNSTVVASAYQPDGYKNSLEPKVSAALVDASGRVTEADHAMTVLTEVVSLDSLEAAKVRPQPLSSDFSDELLEAAENLHSPELLTLKISYRLSAVDLVQGLELPRIGAGVDLALADKDFKLAIAAAGLGKKLKETPRKPAALYNEILTFTEENTDHPADDSAKPRVETRDDVKRTVE